MNHPIHSPILAYLVVSVQEDFGLSYDQFQTYEQALEFVNSLEEKSCIIGPICQQAMDGCGIEDHT